MARLLIHVEGQTEETFVNELLAPHLYAFGYTQVGARLLGNARQKSLRGGIIRGWESARADIANHFRQDPACLIATMVDYYGLPQTGEKAWPGRAAATRAPYPAKAHTVELALLNDVVAYMGPSFNAARFIPFVIMHEFEGLLFSDCERFAQGIGQPTLAPKFAAIRASFSSPEEINDSPLTAPSKRVEQLVPGYQKPLLGGLAALEIGLDAIRAECPHFREWLMRLEAWPAQRKA